MVVQLAYLIERAGRGRMDLRESTRSLVSQSFQISAPLRDSPVKLGMAARFFQSTTDDHEAARV
jgi:hypothetical protein